MGNECNYALQTALYKCNIFELFLTYFANNNNIDEKFAIFCNIFCKKIKGLYSIKILRNLPSLCYTLFVIGLSSF